MMNHPSDAWKEGQFKDIIAKVIAFLCVFCILLFLFSLMSSVLVCSLAPLWLSWNVTVQFMFQSMLLKCRHLSLTEGYVCCCKTCSTCHK